jgi:hypothetical protein
MCRAVEIVMAGREVLWALFGFAVSTLAMNPANAENRAADDKPAVAAPGTHPFFPREHFRARHHRDRPFVGVPAGIGYLEDGGDYNGASDLPPASVTVDSPLAAPPPPPPTRACPPAATGSSFDIEESGGIRVIRGRPNGC